MTEEAVTSAAHTGQPRTPVLGDRRQAAGGPDGTTHRETAGLEPEESQSPQGPGTPRPTSRGRLGRAAEVVMAGLATALTVIEEALADPSQTAVWKLEVGTATWRTLADAWGVEKAGGPDVSQESSERQASLDPHGRREDLGMDCKAQAHLRGYRSAWGMIYRQGSW